MRVLVDMSLTPDWVGTLQAVGHEAVHWSVIGDAGASDTKLMDWARTNGYIVFTHDLDFGAILAHTGAASPSVIQMRTQNPVPSAQGRHVLAVLTQFEDALRQGALLSIDETAARVRILPL